MKVIISGDREFDDMEFIFREVDRIAQNIDITEVISGKSRGVDKVGEAWAEYQGIPVKPFPANWNLLKLAAGPIRNGQMADYADALIAFKGPKSKGTANMIKQAKEKNLKIFIVPLTAEQIQICIDRREGK